MSNTMNKPSYLIEYLSYKFFIEICYPIISECNFDTARPPLYIFLHPIGYSSGGNQSLSVDDREHIESKHSRTHHHSDSSYDSEEMFVIHRRNASETYSVCLISCTVFFINIIMENLFFNK